MTRQRPLKTAQSPKQQRSMARVAAILRAAAVLFQEKGYDAATMTEVAERSNTAIGSLYRFFPSKDVLATSLLEHYAQSIVDGIAALAQQVGDAPAQDLAERLVAGRIALSQERRLVLALTEARGGSQSLKAKYRQAIVDAFAALLHKRNPDLDDEQIQARAWVMLHILKAVPVDAATSPMSPAVLGEIRRLLTLYLA